MIDTARRVTGHPIPAVDSPRQLGDTPQLVAYSEKIRRELGWKPKYPDLTDIVFTSAWDWHRSSPVIRVHNKLWKKPQLLLSVMIQNRIFSLCLHEFSHALVAYYGGDTSVKDKGYLTSQSILISPDIFDRPSRDFPIVGRYRLTRWGILDLDGLTNVLSEPEFLESNDARRAVRLFEERSLLQDLLARTTNNATVGGVQVLIGGEGKWEDLKQCSVVLARYGIPGLVTGTLGVFGPMRMPYARTIPTVRFMADLLSGLVSETMVGEENEQ